MTVVLLQAPFATGLSAEQGSTPRCAARLTGFSPVLTSFDPKAPAELVKLHAEAFSADLKQRISAAQLRDRVTRMRQDFGAFTIGEIRLEDPDSVMLMVNGEKEQGVIRLGVDGTPPHLITSIGIDIGGRGGDDDAVPDINGMMPAEKMSRAWTTSSPSAPRARSSRASS